MNRRPSKEPRYGKSPIPDQAGIGLKPIHFTEILQSLPAIGWFEVHPENYLVPGGPMLHYLGKIRQHYPLSFHCVGMSPGSASGINTRHVKNIRELSERFEPALISDHLSWSSWQDNSLNDLLPLPCSEAALNLLCNNIDQIQNLLGRAIAIENPSAYLQLQHSAIPEYEFLTELSRRSGADLLLDINNIYVSACNQGWSAQEYIDHIPADKVLEIHLAGHLTETLDDGELLRIDDHGSRVCEAVWRLYEHALLRFGTRPTLIEWDTNVPALSVLMSEAAQAQVLLDSHTHSPPIRHRELACG